MNIRVASKKELYKLTSSDVAIPRVCLLALDNKKIVGQLIYLKEYSHYANYIEELHVEEKHRRKGIATALIKKFIQISKKEQSGKQPYVLSSTHIANTISIRMHQRFGFKKIGRLTHLHYGKDEIFFAYKMR